ncbi:MAG: heme ABC transporter permease [Methanobacteriota archaeon]|nr:MAG: heme ABC transporter permease [Euryarchaeota archaeon]
MNPRHILAVTKKDIKAELRGKETLNFMFLFSFISLLMFNFATDPYSPTLKDVAPGFLWFVFIFTGMLGLSRAFLKEKETGTLEGLQLAPLSKEDILYAKIIYNLLLMLAIEAVAFPLFIVLFNYEIQGSVAEALIVLTLGNIGFVIVGSFMSALVMSARSRELVLQIIVLPLLLPVIILTIIALRKVMIFAEPLLTIGEIKLVVSYVAIMAVLSSLLFEYILEE